MLKFKKILYILFFLPFAGIFSQSQKRIDSLTDIAKTQVDTAKAASLLRLGWELHNIGEYNEARKNISEAEKLAAKIDFKIGVANARFMGGIIEMYRGSYEKARTLLLSAEKYYVEIDHKMNLTSVYNSIGVSYFREGNFEKALQYYQKALKMNEALGKKSGIAATLTNMGSIYYIQGKVALALDYNFRSLKIEQEIGNKKGEASSLTTIAIIYKDLKQVTKSIEFLNKSLEISEARGDKAGISNALMNLGDSYFSMYKDEKLGKDSVKTKKLIAENRKKALDNFTRCVTMFEELGDKSSQGNALSGIGLIYAQEKDYKKGLPFLLKSLKITEEINDLKGVCTNCSAIARAYLMLKDVDKAIEYGTRSLTLAKQMNAIEDLSESEKVLSETYLEKKDADLAMKHYKNYIAIKDSVFNIENKKNITEIETKYETEIKDKVNEELTLANQVQQLELNKNKYLIFGLAALLLLCLTIAYVVIMQNKLKHTQKSMLLEQKLLRSQMNPHFIFNALTAIESFIYKNEPREAGRYLSGFARLMRLILENSREDYVTLEKEINTLEHYLNLQKLRFDNSFSYTINVSGNIDINAITIPPMLAQPFIENSIEHGLKNSSRKGEIILNFSLTNNELVFEARDNGIGFEKSMEIKNTTTGHKSMATTITFERLKNLNRNKSKKIKWTAEDIKDQINNVLGTRVVFTIPFKDANVG